MLRSSVIAMSLIVCLAGVAGAQQQSVKRAAILPPQGGEVRVNVSVNFFVQAPMNDSQAAVKAQEEARRILYESAGRECDVLRAAIAEECRLESINVHMNRNYGRQQPDGFNAGGNFGYRVRLK